MVKLRTYNLSETDVKRDEAFIELYLSDKRSINLYKERTDESFFNHFGGGKIQIAWDSKNIIYEAIFYNDKRVFPR